MRKEHIAIPVRCPYCGAFLEIPYISENDLWYNCCICHQDFEMNQEAMRSYIASIRKERSSSGFLKWLENIGNTTGNGFCDPYDPAQDGLDGSGW